MEFNLVAQRLEHLPGMLETRVRSLGWEDPVEKEMAAHSSILAWRIPWTVACQAPLSMGSQRVRDDLATKQQQDSVPFNAAFWGFPDSSVGKESA